MIISCLHCLPYPVTNLITKFCISDGSFTAALYLLQTYHDFLFYVNGILTAPRIFKAAQFIELTWDVPIPSAGNSMLLFNFRDGTILIQFVAVKKKLYFNC
jgi:hypothetical protein